MEDGISTVESSVVTVGAAGAHISPTLSPARAAPAYLPRLSARGALPRPLALVTWLRLVRPATLPLSLAPAVVALAVLWANGAPLAVPLACMGVLAVALVQAGANMLDEYFENERHSRAAAARWSGGTESRPLLADSGIYPLDALRAGVALLVVGAGAGIPLALAGGLPVVLLGLAGLTVAFWYSATRHALKGSPLGDGAVLLALGPGIVVMISLSQHATPVGGSLLLGIALGLFALGATQAAHLHNLPRDDAARRRTLPRWLGERPAERLCVACLACGYLLVALVALPLGAPHLALLAFLSLPSSVVAATGALCAAPGEPRRVMARQFLRAYGAFALLLALGVLLSGVGTLLAW